MGEHNLLRQGLGRRVIAFGAISMLAAVSAACSSSTPVPADDRNPALAAQGEIGQPDFDTADFASINPAPQIRELDYSVDLGFNYVDYERDRIPRDAISPVYSPAFVSPGDATLRPDELVMGLVVNGDARAYPVGMMRIREMVNDEVGGTPVLVSW